MCNFSKFRILIYAANFSILFAATWILVSLINELWGDISHVPNGTQSPEQTKCVPTLFPKNRNKKIDSHFGLLGCFLMPKAMPQQRLVANSFNEFSITYFFPSRVRSLHLHFLVIIIITINNQYHYPTRAHKVDDSTSSRLSLIKSPRSYLGATTQMRENVCARSTAQTHSVRLKMHKHILYIC